MKLYTEEQVRQIFENLSTANGYDYNMETYCDSLTPIELPSDEEIWNEGKLVFNNKGYTIYTHYNTVPSWSDGAKWMRNKIEGGNK